MRRLFVFAAYNKDGNVLDSLLYYLKALAALGDISFYADCPMDLSRLGELGERLVYAGASRHGEYDFGSYKRAFFAVDRTAYDVVYFLNDSVYGPFGDLGPYLLRMEALGADAFGMVMNSRHSGPHLHSWFLGFKPVVFESEWFKSFLEGVRPEDSKTEVCVKYEVGLSRLLHEHSLEDRALFYVNRKKIYNAPLALYHKGLPFVKRDSFVRHNACLQGQLDRLLREAPSELSGIVLSETGPLCTDGIRLAGRYLSYFFRKLIDPRRLDRRLLGARKILLGHILNPYLLNADKARERRYEVYGRVVPEYFSKHYLDSVKDVLHTSPEDVPGREKIFTLWLQGEENAPRLVRNCFERMRRYCGDRELIVLDADKLKEYTDLPGYIWRKYDEGKISRAQFSDICRLDLLFRYGGFWIDSTCYMTGPIPSLVTDSDFFVYMAGNRVKWNYGFIQSCFIRARKGCWLVSVWRRMMFEFWKNEDSKVDYLQLHLMLKAIVNGIPAAAEDFSRMPKLDQDPTHELWFAHGDEAYDPDFARSVAARTFFQKTTYNTGKVIPGSFKEHILNDR